MSNQTEWWAPVERGDEVTRPVRRRPARHRPRPSSFRPGPAAAPRSSASASVAVAAPSVSSSSRSSWCSVPATSSSSSWAASSGRLRRRRAASRTTRARATAARPWSITPGRPGAQMAATLVDAGVVGSAKAFNTGVRREPRRRTIQPGTYNMLLEMKAVRRDRRAARPGAAARRSEVTIPEGLTRDQTLDQDQREDADPDRRAERGGRRTPRRSACRPRPAATPRAGSSRRRTTCSPDATAASVLHADDRADGRHPRRAKGVPHEQWADVLNKASLVEREAKLDEDRPKIARGDPEPPRPRT